jgi:dihydroorotase
MKILIRGGQIIDPANGREHEVLDLLLMDGKVASIGRDLPVNGAKVIDARGLIVTPGLVDMHAHFREPGQEHKETIRSGTRAAASGGFTSVAAMANTQPVADSPWIIRDILDRAKRDGIINVFSIGSVTLGLRCEQLVDVGELVSAGAVAISDDGEPVRNSEIMKQALMSCKEYGIPVISHCEEVKGIVTRDQSSIHRGRNCSALETSDYGLETKWVMNRGEVSSKLGLVGLPNSAEELMVERDVKLAEDTGAHLHIAHVSTAGSVELIRRAKERGINVTAEATPHHFTLTDTAVEKYGANAKMNPPLRSQEDVDAVIAGLSDGTIDVIATDHAPHTQAEKALGIEEAPFGVVGLETCLPLVITRLVNAGHLTMSEAVAKMTVSPARILNLNKGALAEGADADITIIDMEKEQVIDVSKFESNGRNTPFAGWKLKGWPVMTIVGGEIVATSNTCLVRNDTVGTDLCVCPHAPQT